MYIGLGWWSVPVLERWPPGLSGAGVNSGPHGGSLVEILQKVQLRSMFQLGTVLLPLMLQPAVVITSNSGSCG